MNVIDCDELSSSIRLNLALFNHKEEKTLVESKEVSTIIVPSAPAELCVKEEPDPTRHIPKDESTIKYGAAASSLPGHSSEKYYLTTAIAYTNGYPHIGHAYEFLSADVLVRYHRIMGFDTYFLTGSDEHGQKVATSAETAGRDPLSHCDIYVNAFKALNQRLAVSNDQYIRTTDPYHELTAQRLWERCASKDDIYLDAYEGWYNEREELFVTDTEAEATNFNDPGSGLPLKRVREESYFFRMSKYLTPLIDLLESTPTFLQPEMFRAGILSRLRAEGLRDLSISRTSFTWGIPVPKGFDERHVMYVWFDALSNYLSGIHALDADHPLASFWPCNHHIIGKDIVWFHAVIWPCMLMSADLPLPGGIFSHGFVNAADGRKMSKSYDNTVDPHDMLDKYPLDSIRYYLTASTTYGTDINFSEPSLVTMHNAELADTLGNLVHRGMNLCAKYCAGVIPDVKHDPSFQLPFDVSVLVKDVINEAKSCGLNTAVFLAMDAVRATNRFLTEAEPWKMKGENESRRVCVVRTTLEALYVLAHLLAPVMPITAEAMFEKLGTSPVPILTLKSDMYNLIPGTPVTVGEILFHKIDSEILAEMVSASKIKAEKSKEMAVATKKIISNDKKNNEKKEKKKDDNEEKKTESKEKKEKKEKKKDTEESTVDSNQCDFSKIDLRVGQIVRVWNHETADRLYCEEIDIGEASPRQVASGLREHYTLEQMQGRKLIVVCNLKPAKMMGFISAGMVLAAKSADGKVELVSPPENAVVGERVVVEGLVNDSSNTPWTESRVKKYKVWENMSKDLKTRTDLVACWQGQPLLTSAGHCTVQSVSDSQIA